MYQTANRTSAFLAAVATVVTPLSGQIRMTQAKALELAFPGCKIERRTVTIDKAKKAAIQKLCGQKFGPSMVFPYIGRRDGKTVGVAWFDVHTVRSKKQLLMVVVDLEHRVARVELLAFAEPPRYAPAKRWMRRLNGRRLGGVRPGRDVPRIAGATITVRATTRCVDRVLALHRAVFGKPNPPRKPRSRTESKKRR